jgi:poly(A) polymerase
MNDLFSIKMVNLFARLQEIIPRPRKVYLVGGAVRDLLLRREVHDLDLVVDKNVFSIARQVANEFGGAYYPMDQEHGTARVILNNQTTEKVFLDFNLMRGDEIAGDLKVRDFTINSMAFSLDDLNTLIDPLGGARDLREKQLRTSSKDSINMDPLRILRGVRISVDLGLVIDHETLDLMRHSISGLNQVSGERLRDELFRIFDGPKPDVAIRIIDRLGVIPFCLVELDSLKGVKQSPPHMEDVWEHTLRVVRNLKNIFQILDPNHDPEKEANFSLGLLSIMLGQYRENINDHLESWLNPNRSQKSLLVMAALYHDVAKPQTNSTEENGRIRFFNHELDGSKVLVQRGRDLRLSNDENERLETIVRNHMRLLHFIINPDPPSSRAIYRYFRQTGSAGIDICLLTLADVLATYGPSLPADIWVKTVETVQIFFNARWKESDKYINLPSLVNGNEIMIEFGLMPGPEIGHLLEAIREAQAEGEINSRSEALLLASQLITKKSD